MLTLGSFAVELAVAASWPTPYRFSARTISDLGITTCAHITPLGGGSLGICSPRHLLMNISFIAVGLLTAAGTILTGRIWPPHRVRTAGLVVLTLSAAGGVVVGLAPVNENLPVHNLGAFLKLSGTLALILFGLLTWRDWRRVSVLCLLCGVLSTLAAVLFFSQLYLGLGPGAMERLAIEPQTLWTGLVGVILFCQHINLRRSRLLEPPIGGRAGTENLAGGGR